jgi:AcrR family transcriptional regulator
MSVKAHVEEPAVSMPATSDKTTSDKTTSDKTTSDKTTSDKTGRVQRADARRNHAQLLAAAGELYAERGIDVSLEDVARRAGVGIGTLYRHFPTRDALNEAVYRNEVEQLCDAVEPLLAANPPEVALRTWMHRFAGYVAKKRGMAAALKSALGADNELFTYSRTRIQNAIGSLVTAAMADGSIRIDANPDDVLRALSGICMASDLNGGDATERLIDLIVDGLRYGAAAR